MLFVVCWLQVEPSNAIECKWRRQANDEEKNTSPFIAHSLYQPDVALSNEHTYATVSHNAGWSNQQIIVILAVATVAVSLSHLSMAMCVQWIRQSAFRLWESTRVSNVSQSVLRPRRMRLIYTYTCHSYNTAVYKLWPTDGHELDSPILGRVFHFW